MPQSLITPLFAGECFFVYVLVFLAVGLASELVYIPDLLIGARIASIKHFVVNGSFGGASLALQGISIPIGFIRRA